MTSVGGAPPLRSLEWWPVCFLASLLAAQAAPKTAAGRAHERAQLRAAQHEAAMNRDDAGDNLLDMGKDLRDRFGFPK